MLVHALGLESTEPVVDFTVLSPDVVGDIICNTGKPPVVEARMAKAYATGLCWCSHIPFNVLRQVGGSFFLLLASASCSLCPLGLMGRLWYVISFGFVFNAGGHAQARRDVVAQWPAVPAVLFWSSAASQSCVDLNSITEGSQITIVDAPIANLESEFTHFESMQSKRRKTYYCDTHIRLRCAMSRRMH